MNMKRFEKWIWILIYGGLIGISLGWFLQARAMSAGVALMVAGGIVAAVGAVLVFVRSRMGP